MVKAQHPNANHLRTYHDQNIKFEMVLARKHCTDYWLKSI